MRAPAAKLESKSEAWLLASVAASLLVVFLGTTQRGLWEDGYFVVRFAYHALHHSGFAWNAGDGPIYGMTSQLLQLLGTLLYAIAPHHMVLGLKGLLYAAAFATLWVIGRGGEPMEVRPGRFAVASVGLSLPLVLEIAQSGLETVISLLVVAISARTALAFARAEATPLQTAATVWLVYVTRPDAVLVPIVSLGILLLAKPADRRRLLVVAVVIVAGLAGLLLVFRLYYGTALPLPFYVKTRALAAQANLESSLFDGEKTKNAIQAAFFALPFCYIALHRLRSEVLSLLGAALALSVYHFVATVETMGQLSRFYLPAFVPVLLAATLAYPDFRATRRSALTVLAFLLYVAVFFILQRWDEQQQIHPILERFRFYPFLLATGLLLLWPNRAAALGTTLFAACILGGALVSYPIDGLHFEDDETILLRQIAPRRVFHGLVELRKRLPIRTLFHTDMGAPGVLFPQARVVDLDGLLNEDVTLRHIPFDELCAAEPPDAIFIPNAAYTRLRREVLGSECLRQYRRAERHGSQHLMIRADLYAEYAHHAPDE